MSGDSRELLVPQFFGPPVRSRTELGYVHTTARKKEKPTHFNIWRVVGIVSEFELVGDCDGGK